MVIIEPLSVDRLRQTFENKVSRTILYVSVFGVKKSKYCMYKGYVKTKNKQKTGGTRQKYRRTGSLTERRRFGSAKDRSQVKPYERWVYIIRQKDASTWPDANKKRVVRVFRLCLSKSASRVLKSFRRDGVVKSFVIFARARFNSFEDYDCFRSAGKSFCAYAAAPFRNNLLTRYSILIQTYYYYYCYYYYYRYVRVFRSCRDIPYDPFGIRRKKYNFLRTNQTRIWPSCARSEFHINQRLNYAHTQVLGNERSVLFVLKKLISDPWTLDCLCRRVKLHYARIQWHQTTVDGSATVRRSGITLTF